MMDNDGLYYPYQARYGRSKSGGAMTTRDPYFLGHKEDELQRLQQQARDLADVSRRFFEKLGVGRGACVVEIGCGPEGCLGLLADCVGSSGSVVGVEMNERAVQLARRFVTERGFTNVEVRHGNGRATGLARASFDLATARLVLVNIPEPEEVVGEMAALVRPGGTVALHEADWCAHVFDPPLPARDRLFAALRAYSEANGIDLFIGRRLPRLLRAAGLIEVEVQPLIGVYPSGDPRRRLLLQFANNLHERIIAHGLITEAEFAEASAALVRHLDDPATLVVSTVIFQAWARKPQ
jgi:SAM-dependent methyltransferase